MEIVTSWKQKILEIKVFGLKSGERNIIPLITDQMIKKSIMSDWAK